MSMPKIEKNENPIDREQSVSNLIESVALMETGLSHIVNAEGEKIQKLVNAEEEPTIDDMLKVNNSVEKMVSSISKLEMILQNKLDTSKDLGKGENPITETYGAIIPYSGSIHMTTLIDGTPDQAGIVPFGPEIVVSHKLNGETEVLNIMQSIAYFMPRNGTLTDFSAFYELGDVSAGVDIEKRIIARLYKADGDSKTYYPIDDVIIYFDPIPPNVTEYYLYSQITDLNIELIANTKIMLVFYCIADDGVTTLYGRCGAGLNIK